MQDETIDAEFTQDLYDHLVERDFTHIMSLGVDDSIEPIAEEKDTYWLLPLKKNDPRVEGSEPSSMIQPIGTPDIIDMVAGEADFVFMVKMPAEEMVTYLKER